MLEAAFLQAIAEHPDEDRYRLVYADWLDDLGDARAALVRSSRGVPRCRATTWASQRPSGPRPR